MTNDKFSFFVINVVLLLVFVGFINIIFDLHKLTFFAEFIALGVLMLIALISMVSIYNDINFGWSLMSFTFALILIDLLFVFLLREPNTNRLLLTAILGIVGFIISMANIQTHHKVEKESVKETSKKVNKEFKPGKYIASKSGAKYHAPKCDWAKKIKKANAVWFNSKEEAKKAGYKQDKCV